MSQAFYFRGLCYNSMGDFQRALHDFSVAIRIAQDNGEDGKTQADYYSKLFSKLIISQIKPESSTMSLDSWTRP